MNKAYKYRLYPTVEQIIYLIKTFGCCRFVFNTALNWRILAYNADGTYLSYNDTSYGLTALKHQYPWLNEVDSVALQQSLRHLDVAYKNFFHDKKIGFPKFKSKRKSRKSYTTININDNIKVLDNGIKLPKAGVIKAKISRMAPDGWKLKSVTVSMEADGTFYCSVLYEYDTYITPVSVDTGKVIGLDYVSDGLYTDSDGNTCGSPKYYRNAHDRLAREQKRLSRKYGNCKGESKSCNYIKQQRKVNKVYRHISNQRKDFLHKQSTGIANRYDIVCVENLDMKAMSNKGFGNGKATMDNGYGMFLSMLEYKLSDRGKYFVKVDKWYPSSQLCHHCGFQNPITKNLRMTKVTCPVCGAVYDRNYNAALNIRDEGLRLLKSKTKSSA